MKHLFLLFVIDVMYLGVRFMWWHWSNEHEEEYETGFYVAKLDKFHKKLIQFVCGIITKHPPSSTEWGYGGGEYADRWCRWCDKQYQVHKESVYFTHPDSKGMMKGVTKEANDE